MSDESERILYEVHAGVMALDAKMDDLADRLRGHIDDDKDTHKAMGKEVASLQEFRTRVLTVVKVAAVAAPFLGSAFWWLAGRVLAQ